MILAVVSCYDYRDAWHPFFRLLDMFWPSCPYPKWLVTDRADSSVELRDVRVYQSNAAWCQVVANFAHQMGGEILMLQEDFFLNAPVHGHLVSRGLEQLTAHKAGCVRLYPCPGGDVEYGDDYFALVPRGTPYRVSCQAAIWNADYLHRIASRSGASTADFELAGTSISDYEIEPVMAFRREVQPWPLEYLCSAISRGKWNPDAKRLCDRHGIQVDWTKRKFAA